jgi:multicomponent Na+:H+ antiporter subunit F
MTTRRRPRVRIAARHESPKTTASEDRSEARARTGASGSRGMTIVWVIAAVMLSAAALITMFRLLAGPSTLDRLVALDTLVAVTMCSIGTWAAFSLDTTVTYGLTALALISFVGSVSVARFRVPDTDKSRAARRLR